MPFGSHHLRQEAAARAEEPDVAFQYETGLKGLAITNELKLVWRELDCDDMDLMPDCLPGYRMTYAPTRLPRLRF